ncbi:triose-phosphate transporter [Rhizoctonia solani 123E]|uniref:Triose-phosphate transporter n=1 Tax=Rhizoctonia solani 123E TaxID=1423351 RepID=A0A074S756_9AGAM|nr:triose-phosphate transporter [Rhizoctonia solani 123E]
MSQYPPFLSKNPACVSLSGPERSAIWSLPTPPPSLSELSTLACASPPPKSTQLGGGRSGYISNETSDQHLLSDQPLPKELLPLSHTPLSRSNPPELRPTAWPVPWFGSIASLRQVPAQSLRSFLATGTIRSRLTGLGASVGTWLTLYLACNLALTLHNKCLLNDFPFPWLLTALHAFCAALGSWICVWQGVFEPAPLNHPTTPILALFSILYSANIAASNASLQLVSIATHQVVRAATPLFVIGFAWIGQSRFNVPGSESNRAIDRGTSIKRRTGCLGITSAKLKSLTPVILGVIFATYGDYSYTRAGLALTLFGTALAALKTILATRVVQARTQVSYAPHAHTSNPEFSKVAHSTHVHSRRCSIKRVADEGYLSVDEHSGSNHPPTPAPALHPLDVLLRLSPLACVQCLIMAFFTGEISRRSASLELAPIKWRTLALNGSLAFLLNYVSFVTSRRAGALSMTVAANVKQVLTILIALLVFNAGTPSATHLVGIALTLGGGIWYGYLEVKEKNEASAKDLDERTAV